VIVDEITLFMGPKATVKEGKLANVTCPRPTRSPSLTRCRTIDQDISSEAPILLLLCAAFSSRSHRSIRLTGYSRL
jgi:hypothetical protein